MEASRSLPSLTVPETSWDLSRPGDAAVGPCRSTSRYKSTRNSRGEEGEGRAAASPPPPAPSVFLKASPIAQHPPKDGGNGEEPPAERRKTHERRPTGPVPPPLSDTALRRSRGTAPAPTHVPTSKLTVKSLPNQRLKVDLPAALFTALVAKGGFAKSQATTTITNPSSLGTVTAQEPVATAESASLSLTKGETEKEAEMAVMNATAKTTCALPWWKLILVDMNYRQRLEKLSTEGYRRELSLLQDDPGQLSGTDGLEQRKAWQQRHWWKDALGDYTGVPPDTPQQHLSGTGMTGEYRPRATSRMSSRPPLEEVNKIVAMSQYVLCRVPPRSTIAATVADTHPRAVTAVSALSTIRQVALSAFLPGEGAGDHERQEAAVDSYLARARRLSREMNPTLKARLADEIAAGRRPIPTQTAIVQGGIDAEAVTGGGGGASRSPAQAVDYAHRGLSSGQAALRAPVTVPPPPNPGDRPPTPPWMRRQLPLGRRGVASARHDIIIADIKIGISELLPCILPASVCGGGAEARLAANEAARLAMHEQQHQTRCREAATACVDGTEHLYGLQYVWRLPLPPSGFIRVSPDPRWAMWPLEAPPVGAGVGDEEASGKEGNGGGGVLSLAGSTKGTEQADTTAGNQNGARAMRRLAKRVNARNRRLQWLHRVGREKMTYNDLPLPSDDNDDDATSSTSSSSSDASTSGVTGHNAGAHHAHPRHAAAEAVTTRAAQEAGKAIRDGALYVNIYAEVSDESKLAGGTRGTTRGAATAAVSFPHLTTTRRTFIGCFRQSRLLLHHKIYCRALYEEARMRYGGALAHLVSEGEEDEADSEGELKGEEATTTTSRTQKSESVLPAEVRHGLLRSVPHIPFPVLRVQVRAPRLRQANSRHTVDVGSIAGARTWEGLFPSPSPELSHPSHFVWRELRASPLIKSAIRDLFEDLPHDQEGLISKRTFVLLVLQLLELFFPTHLSTTTHVAIAEEEWVYRGTSEHLGLQAFHEKFFGFPFIFLRDIDTVTETAVVEFWSLVRVCFAGQRWVRDRADGVAGLATAPAEQQLASLHLLVPLTGFTEAQLRGLVRHPPPAFDPILYDRFCLMTDVYRSDPQVLAAPPSQQLRVAQIHVEEQLYPQRRTLKHEVLGVGQRERAMKTTTSAAAVVAAGMARAGSHPPLSSTSDAGQIAPAMHAHTGPGASTITESVSQVRLDKTVNLLSVVDLLSGTADLTRRADVEAAVQRERAERRSRQETQERLQLLEESEHYQSRRRRLRNRTAQVLSGIESTSSAWALHSDNVYSSVLPSVMSRSSALHLTTVNVKDAAATAVPEVEETLLDYLDRVPSDVFEGRVSLRERYVLHAALRGAQVPAWMQQQQSSPSPEGTCITPTMEKKGDRSSAAPAPSMDTIAHRAAAEGTLHYLAAMHGKDDAVQPRQAAVAAESHRAVQPTKSKFPRAYTDLLAPGDAQARARILQCVNDAVRAAASQRGDNEKSNNSSSVSSCTRTPTGNVSRRVLRRSTRRSSSSLNAGFASLAGRKEEEETYDAFRGLPRGMEESDEWRVRARRRPSWKVHSSMMPSGGGLSAALSRTISGRRMPTYRRTTKIHHSGSAASAVGLEDEGGDSEDKEDTATGMNHDDVKAEESSGAVSGSSTSSSRAYDGMLVARTVATALGTRHTALGEPPHRLSPVTATGVPSITVRASNFCYSQRLRARQRREQRYQRNFHPTPRTASSGRMALGLL